VRDVSLEIARGEMLVIMGLSGSGKSTLVRCLSRLIEITGGSCASRGRISGAPEKELIELRRSKMGMVFQSFGLLPHRTVLENVAFPLEMRGQAGTRRKRRAGGDRAGRAGGARGILSRASCRAGSSSASASRAASPSNPDIWFLDEPFSALDPLIRREMQDEFLRLQGMLGKTIVFITHDFDEALRLADRIAIMKDGAVEQCDTPDRIVLDPATDYVRKFTEDVDKARVVHAGALAKPINGAALDGAPEGAFGGAFEGAPVPAGATIHDLARLLVEDPRDMLPVEGQNGAVVGALDRRRALDVLLGDR
jgi:glycine betaine/proline transport system ATP-binding protein